MLSAQGIISRQRRRRRTNPSQQAVSTVRISVSEPLIPVYRMYQPSLSSPCIMGEPSRTCALHAYCQSGHPCKYCRRGKVFECERAYPTPPAFAVRFAGAVQLVRDGFATFIHQNSALRLTFEKPTHLRDISCKIEEYAMWHYAAGYRFAKVAVNLGWGKRIPVIRFVRLDAEELPQTVSCFT